MGIGMKEERLESWGEGLVLSEAQRTVITELESALIFFGKWKEQCSLQGCARTSKLWLLFARLFGV